MTLQLQPGAGGWGGARGGQAVMSGCSAAEGGKCRQRAGLVSVKDTILLKLKDRIIVGDCAVFTAQCWYLM